MVLGDTHAGYKLEKNFYLMTEEEIHIIYACGWLVRKKKVIKETAEHWDYSKTTLWRRIHKVLPELSQDMYKDVCKQLKMNLGWRGWRNNG